MIFCSNGRTGLSVDHCFNDLVKSN